jgi:hypothetical protein
MKRAIFVWALVAVGISAFAQENGKTELNLPDPPMLGKHMARGQKPNGGPPKSPNLTYHNGSVLTSTTETLAIFWGSKWSNAAFVGDKISGLDSWYGTVGGSAYTDTNIEYDDSSTLHVSGSTHHNGSIVDTSTAPSRPPSTSAVLNEVCNVLAQDGNSATPATNGYYPVYVDTRRRNANYCAWHSWGTCGGVPIEFGFFFDLDGDSGCDPGAYPDHSQGLEALVNVSGHELSETMTDPRGSGWYDAQGAENSDKCAWSFGPDLLWISGTQWKIQGNWSNAAYNSSSRGYPNRQGQKGCIDGGFYK